MNATIENLRIFLEERDIGGFLAAYETMVPGADVLSSQLTKITQQIFPTVLHEKLKGALVAGDTVRLWRLVRCGRLLVVDNDLLEGINALLDAAWRESRTGCPAPHEVVDLSRGAGGISTGPTFCKASSSCRDQPG
ncbi:MAG: hypothetical protein IPL15_06910 [Comamonadaceae bacterium]|uniref:hypothetical protein n=1 Tax=Candidatus Skiveiella danica TaxID=3386177 RepID=UPI00390A4356|nr:hypothetical protein [Comamonadaceae bacterium]